MMRLLPNRDGYIEVVVGPMFSGKSEELIRRVKRAIIAQQNVVVFKPKIDDRYHAENVVSHSGDSAEAVAIDSITEAWQYLDQKRHEKRIDVVAIDEAQLFSEDVIDFAVKLADEGIRVIAAGLDADFRREPFGPMPGLLARAEFVDKLQAICQVCRSAASFTQRLTNGRPASHDEPTVQIGAQEAYEPRCRGCYRAG